MVEIIKTELYTQGYTIVQNVLSDTDHKHILKLFIQDLKQINPGLELDGLEHELEGELFNLVPGIDFPSINTCNNKGICGPYGLSQGDAAWFIRTSPNIIDIAKKLLHTDDVVCSTDIISFSTNSQHPETNDGCDNDHMLHVDQAPHGIHSKVTSYQMIYYHSHTVPGGATTVVVPGSHTLWKQHNYEGKGRADFARVTNPLLDAPIRLQIPANSLLIFNSKLVHRGGWGPHRLCFMLAYQPKASRTEEARKSKIETYKNGWMTTHWADICQVHGLSTAMCPGTWQHLVPRDLRDCPERLALL